MIMYVDRQMVMTPTRVTRLMASLLRCPEAESEGGKYQGELADLRHGKPARNPVRLR
jgi:hypothetical protein